MRPWVGEGDRPPSAIKFVKIKRIRAVFENFQGKEMCFARH